MSDTGARAVFEAARRGDRDEVERLLDDAPESIEARGEHGASLLHVAAERDDVDLARLLLGRGADLEVEADWGQTPLEWAANMNAERVAQLLLDRGAQRYGFWTAAALGRLEETRSYFENGALKAHAGRSPRPDAVLDGWPEDSAFRSGDRLSDAFYIACRNGRGEVARFLHAMGADVNAKGYFGASALHWAAGNGHEDVVSWLIEQGADAGARDPKFDATPAGWAREFGHDGLAGRLEQPA